MDAWRVSGTVLPDGDEADWWVRGGVLVAEPVDGAEPLPGRYVLPGLVDAHAHLTLDMSATGLPVASDDLVAANLAAHRAAGVLLVRDIGRVRDEPLAVGAGEPEVQQAGRFLAPENGWVEGLHVATPAEHVLATVAAQLAAGVRWVKVVGDWRYGAEIRLNYDLPLLRAVADATHAAGARLAVHAVAEEAARAAVECGADSVEHGCLLDAGLVETMGARGVAWTPTLAAVTAPPPPGSPDGEADRRRRAERAERMRALLPLAVARGVPVLAGTDTAAHGSLAREVALLAEFGLDPVDALRAATTTARSFLGAPGLAAGAPADLVTYDDDPRSDVAVLARPAAVVHRGVRVA